MIQHGYQSAAYLLLLGNVTSDIEKLTNLLRGLSFNHLSDFSGPQISTDFETLEKKSSTAELKRKADTVEASCRDSLQLE